MKEVYFMAVIILTDSTSYIDEITRRELDIKVVSLGISFGDEVIKETEIDDESFYKMMEAKGIPTSSQPPVGDIFNIMKSATEKGHQLLGVFISSDMSGTYSTALLAKNMVLELYENAQIEIIDSRSNSMQLGFAVVVAARAAKAGKTLLESKEVAEQIIKKSRFLFIPENLEYLKKGGRIGGASALIGSLLKIIPILTVEEGKTMVLTKVRTKKNAIATMLEKMLLEIKEFGLGEIIVHHINCYNEAKQLVAKIKEILDVDIRICDIGPVIGLHVGPGTLAVAYYTKQDLR